jgi:oligosaccharide repeat unit polymerase
MNINSLSPQNSASQPSQSVYFVFQFLILVVSLLSFAIMRISSDALTSILAWSSIFSIIVTYLCWIKGTKSYFDPFILFITSMLLFLSGHQLLYVLGMGDVIEGILNSIVMTPTINTALLQVVVCFSFFGFGTLAAIKINRTNKIAAKVDKEEITEDAKEAAVKKIGFIILAVCFIPMLLYSQAVLERVMQGGYAQLYLDIQFGGMMAIYKIGSSAFISGAILVLSGCRGISKTAVLAISAVIIATLPSLFSGERSLAFLPLMAAGWVWHRKVSPIPLWLIFWAGIILLFIIFPIMRSIREVAGVERTDFGSYWAMLGSIDNPVIAIIDEMGKSLRVVAWTLEVVPSSRGFDWGLSYLYALLSLVPNLGWDVHPSYANRLSLWLAMLIRPEWAMIGGGFGYSFLAEAYLNFGWVGIVVISYLLGNGIAAMVLKVQETNDSLKIALIGCLTVKLLFFPRAETQQVLRDIVWYSILPWVAAKWQAKRIMNKKITLNDK